MLEFRHRLRVMSVDAALEVTPQILRRREVSTVGWEVQDCDAMVVEPASSEPTQSNSTIGTCDYKGYSKFYTDLGRSKLQSDYHTKATKESYKGLNMEHIGTPTPFRSKDVLLHHGLTPQRTCRLLSEQSSLPSRASPFVTVCSYPNPRVITVAMRSTRQLRTASVTRLALVTLLALCALQSAAQTVGSPSTPAALADTVLPLAAQYPLSRIPSSSLLSFLSPAGRTWLPLGCRLAFFNGSWADASVALYTDTGSLLNVFTTQQQTSLLKVIKANIANPSWRRHRRSPCSRSKPAVRTASRSARLWTARLVRRRRRGHASTETKERRGCK